ncbi:hypothetical protein V6N13_004142 [Hibiscus sabdariffa]
MGETLSESKGSSWADVVSLGANGVTKIFSENQEATQLAGLETIPSIVLEDVCNMRFNPNRRDDVMEINDTKGMRANVVSENLKAQDTTELGELLGDLSVEAHKELAHSDGKMRGYGDCRR